MRPGYRVFSGDGPTIPEVSAGVEAADPLAGAAGPCDRSAVKIVCIGGGPGGLYFAILMKKARPEARVIVHERNRSGDTFGFGVVFSDATLDRLKDADSPTYEAITSRFFHWDDIDIHYRG